MLEHDDEGLDVYFAEILGHDLQRHALAAVISGLAATLLQTGLILNFFQRLGIGVLFGAYTQRQAGQDMLFTQQAQLVIARILFEQRECFSQ